MTNPDLEELKSRVQAALRHDNSHIQQLGARVAADLSVLALRAATGEDVSGELAHIQAQALNLTAEAQARVQQALLGWMHDFVLGLAMKVLVT